MAFDPNNPPSLIASGIGGSRGLKAWFWRGTDPIADVIASGYIRTARKLGMGIGDSVRYVDGNDDPHHLVLSAIDPDTGWGTLAFPATSEEAYPIDATPTGEIYVLAYVDGEQVRIPIDDFPEPPLDFASQAEAEAGVATDKPLNALRTSQAIAALQRVLASQAEAEAGVNNTKDMTPLRVAQAIAALVTPNPAIASQAEAEAGSDNAKMMTALRVAQAIASDQDYIKPENFVVGTPSDWTATINAALASATKPILFLTSGKNYPCLGTINIPAGGYILGYGATLDYTGAGNITALNFANGGGVKGVTLTGSGNAAYNDLGRAIYCFGTNNSPAAPTYVRGPEVIDCHISEWGGWGVWMGYCEGAKIIGNRIHDIGYAGVGGVSCNDAQVLHNHIHDISPGSPSLDIYGCFIDRSNGTTEVSEPRSYRCNISFNLLENIDWEALDTHGGVDFTFEGNIINNCRCGIALVPSSIVATPKLAPQRCTVIGNVISNPSSSNSAIICVGAYAAGPLHEEIARDCVISGNVIDGHGQDAFGNVGAILVRGTENVVVTGNTIRNPWASGITMLFQNFAFVISDNTVVNPRSTAYANTTCLYLDGDYNKGIIGGNSFRYSGAISAITAPYSMVFASAGANNDISVDKNAFLGVDLTHLQVLNAFGTGIIVQGGDTRVGFATVTAVNGDASNTLAVVFSKVMPYSPVIMLSIITSKIGAQTVVASVTNITKSGFDLVITPGGGTTWPSGGSVRIDWQAF